MRRPRDNNLVGILLDSCGTQSKVRKSRSDGGRIHVGPSLESESHARTNIRNGYQKRVSCVVKIEFNTNH
jgi:hypothetical protein